MQRWTRSARRSCFSPARVSVWGATASVYTLSGSAEEAVDEQVPHGNDLCWYNNNRSYSRCCLHDADPDCWIGPWYTADFCCYPLPPKYPQCFDDIEARVEVKRATLDDWGIRMAMEGADIQLILHNAKMHDHAFSRLLELPLKLWRWACGDPTSPSLWSQGCACCVPVDPLCEFDAQLSGMVPQYRECCYPVYTRKVMGEPDLALEAAIQAHLGSMQFSRSSILQEGSSVIFQFNETFFARGCIISLRQGILSHCLREHACPEFECSYLDAFILVLGVIQHVNPLPDIDLVLNCGDLTLSASSNLPSFARMGTHWTQSLVLPFEWQLHPAQCVKHVSLGMSAAEHWPWEQKKDGLIWRGSHSNCFLPGCSPRLASDSQEAMKACAVPAEGEFRECKWDLTNWLRMPRGRLLWLSKFVPAIDAKLVLNDLLPIDQELVAFFRMEDLVTEEFMSIKDQLSYKYSITVEGDSAADRLSWQLFGGTVVIMPDGPWRSIAVLDLLEPWVHYVPVRYDLGDLVMRLQWLADHDEEAKRIALRGREFAHRYLTCDAIVYYVDRLLHAYAARLED
eukprot:TRINITY_DN44520_c0_g1_i1.p1 TRINITY_DN44520_c0_g1~~TRINITY_DN44520_c0_g1_i1.p1  ORF type:complete len:578 (+),score=47.17 TRINITY_DN44520_c0_g1_i1:33-1736(+)